MNRQQIKKWSLLRHLNFKGYKRTASGNPLNMIKTMSISKLTLFGNATQSRLPDGYTEVAYIETSGSQSISTGIYPTNLTTVEGKFEINESGNQYVYGCKDIDSDNEIKHGFYISYASGSHFASPCFGAANLRHIVGDSSSTSNILLNTPYSFKVGQDGCYLNDVQIFTFDDTTFSTNTNETMFVGGLNDGGLELETAFKGKIYSFKVYEDGNLIQSLVPCRRDIDDKVGMYDIISDQFLIGGGIGSLVTGNDIVPSPDAPVEVQLCGDKTGNLLDVTQISGVKIEVTDNKIYLSDYACATQISPEAFLEMTSLNPGDTITCSNSAEVISGTANSVLGRVAFSTKNGGTSLLLCSNNTKTVTIPSDFNNDNYTNLLLYGAQNSDESDEQLAVMSNLAIYKGSYTADTLPAYEPYGYKVSGRAEGLNLLDKDSYKIVSNVVAFSIANLKNGEKYTFYSDKPVTWFKISNNQGGYNSVAKVDFTNGFNTFSFTMARNENIAEDATQYLFLSTKSTQGFETDISAFDNYRLAIYKGSYTAETMPSYEPYQPPQDFAVYLPEQIAKVGDVADEVVVDMEQRTAELRKNVGKYALADNVLFSGPAANGNGEFYRYYFNPTPSMKKATGMAGACNVLPEYHIWNSGDFEHVHFGQNNAAIYLILNEEYNNDQDVVSHLSKKAEPYFIYLLATPVTTDITSLQQWDNLPNIEGSVTIKFNSTIPISSAETEYYSKEYDAI